LLANPFHVDCCSICASPMHLEQTCPSLPAFVESPMKQVNAFNDYRKQSHGPFAESYNLGWRNHPNFSWKQNQPMTQGGAPHQSHTQYPPGFHQSVHHQSRPSQPVPTYQAPAQSSASPSQSSLEDTLKAFIQLTGQSINDVKNATMVNTQAIAKMETQIRKIASHLGRERRESSLVSLCQIQSCSSMREVHQMQCMSWSMYKPLSHLGQGNK